VSDAPTMPFGRHKGEPLANVSTGYLTWALEEAEAVTPELRAAIRAELKARLEPPGTVTFPGFEAI